MKLIILAAGQGTRLRPITDDRPKCLVEVAGRPLLDWQLDAARRVGIDDIVVVGGYLADRLAGREITLLNNPHFATTNMVQTLWCARDWFSDGFVMAYGDIVYDADVLRRAAAAAGPIGVVVDREWRQYWESRFSDVLADAESLSIGPDGLIRSVGQKESSLDHIEAQYIGMVSFRGAGVAALRESYERAADADRAGLPPYGGTRRLDQLFMTDLLQGLIDEGTPLHPIEVAGGWLEIDSTSDLALAERLARVADGRLTIERSRC